MLNLNTELARHVHSLAEEIGARPIGSPGNHAAAEYIQAALRAAGSAVERQPYACPAWHCSEAGLELDGQKLAVEANAFSPACDVTAPVVAMTKPPPTRPDGLLPDGRRTSATSASASTGRRGPTTTGSATTK